MVAADNSNKMISCGSYTGTGSDQDTNAIGLPNNHAFSIMRVLIVRDANGTDHRLVELRNPWGIEKFVGDWSSSSDLWTEDLLRQADHTLENDGKYFISFNDYLNNLEYTDISWDISG